MEELQDAIEDAHYMNAMQNNIPKPTKEWPNPTLEELSVFKEKLLKANPRAFEAEVICTGSLGFYFYTKFLMEQGLTQIGNFFIEAALYKMTSGSPQSTALARKIVSDYLVPGSQGCTLKPEERRCDVFRSLNSRSVDTARDATEIQHRSVRVTKSADVEPIPDQDCVVEVSPFDAETDGATDEVNPGKMAKDTRSDEAVDPSLFSYNAKVAPVEEFNRNALRVGGKLVNTIVEYAFANKSFPHNVFEELEQLLFNRVKLEHYSKFFPESPLFAKYLQVMSLVDRPIQEDDFPLFRVLGRGGFGLVSACKRSFSGKLYAVKVMSKHRVKLKKAEKLCLNERFILTAFESPYIVCLKYSFTTATDLFLVLDLMMGGDLSFHLRRRAVFSPFEARYYAARILLGIGALHDLNIVYRDLKPENILMDEYGRTKISDLGLAKKVSRGGVVGTCGTRGYWAPEMIRKDSEGKKAPYGLTVDWFSFGCCVYEFLVGVCPFRTEKARCWGIDKNRPEEINPNNNLSPKDRAIDLAILEMDPDYTGIEDCAKDLLRKLLNKDEKQRLGTRNGFREIMIHPWFKDINFTNLDDLKPPIVPGRDINMFSQSEIGFFSDDKESKKVKLTEADHAVYVNWNYSSSKAHQDECVEFFLKEEELGPIKPIVYTSSCCTIS